MKVGIIGCGGIANGKHLPSLKAINRVDLVAFCDLIEEKAQKAAREYGTPDAKVYTDYTELLKDESIDVVHVLTPNRMHAQISIDALPRGQARNVRKAHGQDGRGCPPHGRGRARDRQEADDRLSASP